MFGLTLIVPLANQPVGKREAREGCSERRGIYLGFFFILTDNLQVARSHWCRFGESLIRQRRVS